MTESERTVKVCIGEGNFKVVKALLNQIYVRPSLSRRSVDTLHTQSRMCGGCREVRVCVCVCVCEETCLLTWCRKYFRVRPDRSRQWALIEQSLDETGLTTPTHSLTHSLTPSLPHSLTHSLDMAGDSTVQRLLGADEDPSQVVNFWGKSKVGSY